MKGRWNYMILVAAPRKKRSEALLVHSQSFIWQLPRVATAKRWPSESTVAQRPHRHSNIAEVQEHREVAHSESLLVSLVAVSDSAAADRTRVCRVTEPAAASQPLRLAFLGEAVLMMELPKRYSTPSEGGRFAPIAISGVVPATRMITRPLYTRHQWATCSSVSCVVRLCPLPLPSNGVVLNFLKIYQNSNTVGCRRRGGTC